MLEFHELIHWLDISHEDVLMKMFVYSLDGDVHEWFQSLPVGTISSLKEFHETFHYYCKGIYSFELIIEDYCEEFKFYIQHDKVDSSSSVEEEFYEEFVKDVNLDQIQEKAILSSLPITQNEEFVEHDVPPLQLHYHHCHLLNY